jgi:hypothetical protein
MENIYWNKQMETYIYEQAHGGKNKLPEEY